MRHVHALLLVCVVGSVDEVRAQSTATVGSVRGVVRDERGEPLAGATVVATSTALVGEQIAITDENGQYFLTSLPPGRYTLTIFFGRTFRRPEVLVGVGKEAVVNVAIDTSTRHAGETIEIVAPPPLVDQGSTKIGITLTDDYTRNIPTGRTFGDTLGAAPGTRADGFGTSFAGATSAENVYLIDGINTTDVGFGGLSTNLPTEFLGETEIIIGGYGAELGRATGGIVNVVTKTGGNQLRGSVFAYWRPGALVAPTKTIDTEGSSLDSRDELDQDLDAGFEVGGPLIKNRLWFHVGFAPSHTKTTRVRLVRSQLDEDDDGVPDVDPSTGFTRSRDLASTEHRGTSSTYFFTSKINGAVDRNHQFQVSLFGNPTRGHGIGNLNGNVEHAPRKVAGGAIDLAAKWTSKLSEGRTQIDVLLGSHRGEQVSIPNGPAADVPLVAFDSVRSLSDFISLERDVDGCIDGGSGDLHPNIVNCPVFGYRTQGGGFVDDLQLRRDSALAVVTHRVKLAGYHVLKAGADLERSTFDHTFSFTGGALARKQPSGRWNVFEELQIVRNLEPTEDPATVVLDDTRDQRLCGLNLRAVCEQVDGARSISHQTTAAAFVQDSWQIRPNLTVNAGVRWERLSAQVADGRRGTVTSFGETIPDVAYQLPNLIAPRLGIIFDPTKEGRSKLFAHWGRFYENLPMAAARFGFGNETFSSTLVNFQRRPPGHPMYDPNCDVDFDNADPGADLYERLRLCRDRRANFPGDATPVFVAPDLRGQYTQDFIAGGELQISAGLRIGVAYHHRSLPVVIEDVSPNGFDYMIANPGRDYRAAADQLRADADRQEAEGNTDLAGLNRLRARQLDHASTLDAPVRNYDALQVTVMRQPTRNSLLQASYTYSKLRGNYDGLSLDDTAQLLPNLTTLFDSTALTLNRNGPLSGDRPHSVKLDGFYLFDLKRAGQLTVGASFRAISGVPHSIRGNDPTYFASESFLLQKGAFLRSPVTAQLDLHLAYGRRLTPKVTLQGFVRVFDVFTRQSELDLDDVYTFERADAIIGGDLEDLKHIKALTDDGYGTGRTPQLNPNFGRPTALQAPRNIQLGMRVTF